MALADRCAVRARSFPRARAGFGGRARGRGAAVRSGLARARHGRERARARRDAVSLSLARAAAPRRPARPWRALWLRRPVAWRLAAPPPPLAPLPSAPLRARLRSNSLRAPFPAPAAAAATALRKRGKFEFEFRVCAQPIHHRPKRQTNQRALGRNGEGEARARPTNGERKVARARVRFRIPPSLSLSHAPVGRSRAVSPRGPARSVGGPPAQPEPQTAPSDGLAPLHRSRPARMERAPRLLRSRTARLAQSLPPSPRCGSALETPADGRSGRDGS